MTYDDCLKEMFGLHRFGIKLGLDIIRDILNGLGNPHEKFQCIHVAGTNGKGSIASTLAAILRESGYRVGLYTSPHLVRFNERIMIDNTELPDDGVVEAYNAVKSVHKGDREPTFFEYTTAMALYAFEKENVDWGVIETGMGGRLDATNIISPEISIISNISLEHRFYLGKTIAEIAGEKGGIIKENTPVITGARQKSVADVLRRIAAEHQAPFYRAGEHFRVRRASDTFTYYGLDHRWKGMRTVLPGAHQVDNAAVILAACEVLMRKYPSITPKTIRAGMESVRWPGRLEILPTCPSVIIDGAHNLDSARRLADFLSDYSAGRPITLVIGILDDKPYSLMLRSLVPLADRVIFTRPKIDRSLPTEKLVTAAQPFLKDFEVIENVGEAVMRAIETTLPENLVCIAGSLYVVGEAKEAIAAMQPSHAVSVA